MVRGPEIISKNLVKSGKYLRLYQAVVYFRGKNYDWDIVDFPQTVGIIAIVNKKLILEKNTRPAVQEDLYEIPAGVVERGENVAAAAERELWEETGYKAEGMRKILSFFVSPGYTSEKMHLFLAKNLRKEKRARIDRREDSFSRVRLLDFREAFAKLRRGEIQDAKTLIALYWLKSNI